MDMNNISFDPMTHPKWVFVFASNTRGRHGKGAALVAKNKYGAVYGKGFGYYGNSFAIPTKNGAVQDLTKKEATLPLEDIEYYVSKFKTFARENNDLVFFCTPIGAGLAGLSVADIAPMFRGSPINVKFPDSFVRYL